MWQNHWKMLWRQVLEYWDLFQRQGPTVVENTVSLLSDCDRGQVPPHFFSPSLLIYKVEKIGHSCANWTLVAWKRPAWTWDLGTWVWGEFPPFPQQGMHGSLCLASVQTMGFILSICFLGVKTGYLLIRGCLCGQPPKSTPGHWVPNRQQWRDAWRRRVCSVWARGDLVLAPDARPCPSPFPFAGSASYPLLIINLNLSTALCWVMRVFLVNYHTWGWSWECWL